MGCHDVTRADYDQIRDRFAVLVSSLRDADPAGVGGICLPDVLVCLEPLPRDAVGPGSLAGFAAGFPRTDLLQMHCYNFVCRFGEGMARQSAYVVCHAYDGRPATDEMDHFSYVLLFSNLWARLRDGWLLSEVRMDVYDQDGALSDLYSRDWQIGERLAVLKPGIRLPRIHGELDSPWRQGLVDAPITPEEEVCQAFVRYDWGVDHLAFSECDAALSERFHANEQASPSDGKREWMSTIKFHRQKSRHWAHPYRFASVAIDGDEARVSCDRMAGERFVGTWTSAQVREEHACAHCDLVLVRERGSWRVRDFNYESGLAPVGPSEGPFYGGLA